MQVPDNIRKCVGFVGYRMTDASHQLAGSFFFLGRGGKDDPKPECVYAITAKHVVDGLRQKGMDRVTLRLNQVNGEAKWFSTPLNDWFFHPTDQSIDVAILKTHPSTQLDHLVFPYSLCLTDEQFRENEIGLGDEVLITGLFRHHHGSRRNIPIVRIGNLAAIDEERVVTESFGEIDAFLIEARSIGGLSGSPVFVHFGASRVIKGQLKIATQPIIYPLGLIHGHFDSRIDALDDRQPDQQDALTAERINTGIAIVVPFRKIDEVVREFEIHEASS